MVVSLFGKNGCARCMSTRRKIAHLLKTLGLEGSVVLEYHDMETVDGLAEGRFNDVDSVPTTILRRGERNIARWDGRIPKSGELKLYLTDR